MDRKLKSHTQFENQTNEIRPCIHQMIDTFFEKFKMLNWLVVAESANVRDFARLLL